ncbi:MAG: PilZ domain-containing protein [Rhizobiaceae bacterium]|jgi:alginate biosynthesis protein Alg44|nr:PilZ domain-containing protein [Rhizobiaceae bacterium]
MTKALVQHEFDRQRQYPRYRIPSNVRVDGHWYEVSDWSLGGFSVYGLRGEPDIGQLHEVEFKSQAGEVDVILKMAARVASVQRSTQRTGFRFMQTSYGQSRLLQNVADAYLRGELPSIDNVVEVSALNDSMNFEVRQRVSLLEAARRSPTRFVGVAAITAIAAFGGWMGLRALYGNLFLNKALASTVVGEGILIAAPTTGHIEFIVENTEVKNGEMIAGVIDREEKTITVDSICDCQVTYRNPLVGSFVNRGDLLLRMLPTNSRMSVSAVFQQSALSLVNNASVVRIEYADGTVQWSTFQSLSPRIAKTTMVPSGETTVELTLDPARSDLDYRNDGQPVSVIIDTAPVPLVGRVLGLVG